MKRNRIKFKKKLKNIQTFNKNLLTKKKDILHLKFLLNKTILKKLNEISFMNIIKTIQSDKNFVDEKFQKILKINQLKKLGNYRSFRLKNKLPLRGQRTHTNAKTRKKRDVY